MSEHIFILTGAGISAESGLGTFRDDDGLWVSGKFLDEKGRERPINLVEVATPEGFAANPARVQAFYNARRKGMNAAAANAGHFALGRLASELAKLGGKLTLVTQNIDALHEAGGAPEVIHMHGEMGKVLCNACDQRFAWAEDILPATACPKCDAVGQLRPDVVWFGEMPYHMDLIHNRLVDADQFVAIGTSGSVYPASDFVSMAARGGLVTTEINLNASTNAWEFSERHYGPASIEVPAWVDRTLARLTRAKNT
jgi:NAD-dependent deacetylase